MPWRARSIRGTTAAVAMLTLLSAASIRSAHAQQADIRGRVTDARTGSGIMAAQVVARDAQGAIVKGVLTDSAGQFALVRVPVGTYTVEVVRLGYERASRGGVRLAEKTGAVVDLALGAVALQADAVVITSTRRVERVADTDVSVAIVSGARLEARAEPTVFGAIKQSPGVDFFSSGLGQQQPNARGFVNPFTTNMLVLVDGRLSSLPGLGTVLPGMMLTTQQDVAQVEVVTGPSSALYGANAANGVLNIITRDPRESRGGSITIGGGDRNQSQIGFRYANVAGERFAFKVSGERFAAREFERYNTFAGAAGYSVQDAPDFDINHQSATGSLYFYPSTGTQFVLSGGATQANYINLTVAGRLQVKDWTAWYQQLRANVANVLGGSLFINTSYTGNAAGDSYYLDVLTRMQIPQANGGAGLVAAAAMQRALFIDRSDRFDVELQHTLHIGDSHFFTSGAMARRSRPVSDGTYLTDGAKGEAIEIDETGAYLGYDNLSIDHLRLTAVGRYDTHSDFSARFSPKLSASYTLPGGGMLRATYNEAFNSPTTYLLYAQSLAGRDAFGFNNFIRGNRAGFRFVNTLGGAVPTPIKSLEPLRVSSFELGYRTSWGSALSMDVTAYRSTYRNYISKEATISAPADSVFALDPRTGTPLRENTKTYLNYGELPVTGADISMEWLPARGWSTQAAFGYQQPGTFRKPVAGLAPPGFNAPTQKEKAAVAYHSGYRGYVLNG